MVLLLFKSSPSDTELIESIREGGQSREKATAFLLKQHVFFVKKLARKFNLPEEKALDAYTDAIMVVLDHVVEGRFRGESKLSTYLYQVFFNKCRDLLKKKSTHTVTLNEWTESWDDRSRSFLKDFIQREEVDQLHKYLDQTGPVCKQILIDWGYWGYKMEEIAQRAGLENGEQVKKRKYKCLQKIRKLLHNS